MLIRRLLYYFRSIFTLLNGITNWPVVIAAFVGLPLRKPFTIHLRQTGIRFKVRTAMDIWIVKETCIDREYERIGMSIQDGWKIIDIGAGVGDFAIDTAVRYANCIVHAYEPFPESFNLLQQNILLNAATNVSVFPESVGPVVGVVALDVSQPEAVQHSTSVRSANTLQVPSTTLQNALSRLGVDKCDLLKLDCEGAEYGILYGADRATLQRIRRIVMEYHNNVTAFSHHDLVRFLEHTGFRVACYPSTVRENIGLLYVTSSATV